MLRRTARPFAIAALSAAIVTGSAPSALAHEERGLGDLEIVVGFGSEPAFAGQPNSVQLILVHDGEPVVDLGDTLDVEVSFGDQSQQFPIEPFFEVGEFGTPGDYRAWFIPTSPGRYTFRFSGTIDGEAVDETFTSGPRTFGDVESPSDVQFPEQPPSTLELAERIDREVPRLSSDIEQARTDSLARASEAADDAAGARALGLIGLVAGALGLIAGVGALVLARKKA